MKINETAMETDNHFKKRDKTCKVARAGEEF
jgi:hypothetical protein